MALLVANKPLSAEITNITPNILDLNDAPHSLTYIAHNQIVTIENNEAVPITVNFSGDGVTGHVCEGYGTIDVSGGKDYTVAAGQTIDIYTTRIGAYLGAQGNTVAITVTGSTAADLAYIWLSEY